MKRGKRRENEKKNENKRGTTRIFCEDISPTYNSIINSKNNGIKYIPKTINGVGGIMVGDNLFLNEKTNIIQKIEE